MKKIILPLLVLSLCSSAMANEITCVGQTTKTSIELNLTGDALFPLSKADYRFNGKVIPTSGFEFGIFQDMRNGARKLSYKFETLKKHPLAHKNSNLVLLITQLTQSEDPVTFNLAVRNEAELRSETNGKIILLDKMDCK